MDCPLKSLFLYVMNFLWNARKLVDLNFSIF